MKPCTVTAVRCPYLDIYVNSFVLRTPTHTVYVDGGLYAHKALYAPFLDGKPGLAIQTHGHWDHTGLCATFRQHGLPLLGHAADSRFYADHDWHWQYIFGQFWKDADIPERRRDIFWESIGPVTRLDQAVEDGWRLSVGGMELEALHTPGHSPGSLCVLEHRSGALFTGDTLMGAGFFTGAPLYADVEAYAASMRRLRGLQVRTVYCDHNDPAPGSALRQKADAGLETMERVHEAVLDIVHARRDAESLSLAEVTRAACARIGRGAGAGACVTVVAHLRLLREAYPTVESILKTHCVDVPYDAAKGSNRIASV